MTIDGRFHQELAAATDLGRVGETMRTALERLAEQAAQAIRRIGLDDAPWAPMSRRTTPP